MGWFTVVAYLAVAWLCLQCFKVEKRGPPRPLRKSIWSALRVLVRHWPRPPLPLKRALVWLVLSALLFLLAINKQFDLQTLFTEIGRVISIEGGWYEQRRTVQRLFIVCIGCGAVLGVAWLWWATRCQLRDFRLTLLGFAFIVAFVLVRASSFHNMDQFIGVELGGIRMNWILELGGITIVGAGAVRRLMRLELSGADYANGVPPPRARAKVTQRAA